AMNAAREFARESAHRPSVVVANLSAPEITWLGVELAQRGVLRGYVRPYLNRQRWWERALSRTPGIGATYARTLGRRTPPADLPLEKVVEAGIGEDFAAAAVVRWPMASQRWRQQTAQQLMFAAERQVAREAGRLAQGANIVVASYGTGRYAF